jgi:hypothetical protein
MSIAPISSAPFTEAHQALLKLIYCEEEPSKQEIEKFFKENSSVNLNVVDKGGKTVLYRAIHAHKPPQKLIEELLNRNAHYKPDSANVTIDDIAYLLKEHPAPSGILALLKVAKNAHEIMDYIANVAFSDENSTETRMACSFILDINEELATIFQKVSEFFNSQSRMQDPAKIIKDYVFDKAVVESAEKTLTAHRKQLGKI